MKFHAAKPAAVAYVASFSFLVFLSYRLLHGHASCADIGGDTLDVRARVALSMPIPVHQFCSGYGLPAALIVCTLLAAALWYAMLRVRTSAATVFITSAAAAIILLATPYIASTDPYAYALYGFSTLHGANPYAGLHPEKFSASEAERSLANLFPSGSYIRVANYGPGAILYYEMTAALAQGSLWRFMLEMRAINALLVFGCAILLLKCRPASLSASQTLLGWLHPLVLIESIAFLHTDILMVALLVVALFAYQRASFAASAVAIVLATNVRSVAGIALLVVIAALAAQHRQKALREVAASAAGAELAVFALSQYIFHGYSLGTSPAVEPYSSPMLLLASFLPNAHTHYLLGGVLQAIVGLALMAYVLARRDYCVAPFATLATLPIVRAWYAQWALPVACVAADVRVRQAAWTMATTAILLEWPEMSGHTGVLTWAVVLAAVWLGPLILFARRAQNVPEHRRIAESA